MSLSMDCERTTLHLQLLFYFFIFLLVLFLQSFPQLYSLLTIFRAGNYLTCSFNLFRQRSLTKKNLKVTLLTISILWNKTLYINCPSKEERSVIFSTILITKYDVSSITSALCGHPSKVQWRSPAWTMSFNHLKKKI